MVITRREFLKAALTLIAAGAPFLAVGVPADKRHYASGAFALNTERRAYLDNLRFYDHALPASEIQRLHLSSSPLAEGLVGWWQHRAEE